jgi:cytochrome c oxidase subunit 2
MATQGEPMSSSPGRKRIGRLLAGLVVGAITLVFAAMAYEFINGGNANHELTTLVPQGKFSDSIQTLVNPVFAIGMLVGVLVIGGIGFIAYRFRDTGDSPDDFPVQLHGKTSFEIGWTALPALILAVVGVFTVLTLVELNKPAPEAIQVEVHGQQWWWGFRYDLNGDGNYQGAGDITTNTELVIPVGKTVQLSVTSNDVIHSFWIPALNGKRDAVPGQHHPWKLEGSTIGVYRGQCTEFCGLSHANMRMIVRVVSQADYDAWVANQLKPAAEPAAGSEAAAGKALFLGQLCASCHLINGVSNDSVNNPNSGVTHQLQSGVAPNLTHLMTRGTFIGSIQNLYDPVDPNDPTKAGDPGNVSLFGDPGAALTGGPIDQSRVNRTELAAWIRNPLAVKPASPVKNKAGLLRGMPNLALTEIQIDQLVAYLTTLN